MVLVSVSCPVFANGFGMALDKVVGDYTANIDYDAVNGIFAGAPVQFAFQLFNKDRTQTLSFTDAWVTVSESETDSSYVPPVFDAGIIQTASAPAGMVFVFPKSGSYDMVIRYDNGEKSLVEATFKLDVVGGGTTESSTFSKNFFLGAFAMLIIAGLVFIFSKMLKLKKGPTTI